MGEVLGHDLLGDGPRRVVVLNDWLSDTGAWDPVRPSLDGGTSTWAFADVRGYGRSRHLTAQPSAAAVARDVVALADTLGWERFAVVGHSMTSLPALHLAQHSPGRVERAAVLTPPPPGGLGADAAAVDRMRALALADDEGRRGALRSMWGVRLTPGWLEFKLAGWRAAADPRAVAAYVEMFARDGVAEPSAPARVPVLAVTGEEDGEPLRATAVRAGWEPLCPRFALEALPRCGHYPMQEMPPLLAAVLERFLGEAES
ncbi:hypothetical protein NUM3379_16190 [Kineococcus sp. NUM-3379]